MVWPENPQALRDIPHNPEILDKFLDVLERHQPEASRILCDIIRDPANRRELEALTAGDLSKEQAFGSVLLQVGMHIGQEAFKKVHLREDRVSRYRASKDVVR